jgi:modification methylase
MGEMPAASVDLIVTSPPYNLLNSTGGGMRKGSASRWKNAELRDGYAGGQTDDMPRAEYVEWQRKCLAAMMRLLPDTGAIFYNHKWRVQNGLLEDQHEILEGFPVRQIIIWQRAGGINFNLSYLLPTYEVIYLICKSEKFRLASKAACEMGDVWSIPQARRNPHPAPFPVEIPKRCIESTDAKTILDPFMGSGTTALAAEMLGRSWIGIELAEDYITQADERIAEWRAQQEKAGMLLGGAS